MREFESQTPVSFDRRAAMASRLGGAPYQARSNLMRLHYCHKISARADEEDSTIQPIIDYVIESIIETIIKSIIESIIETIIKSIIESITGMKNRLLKASLDLHALAL